MPRLRDGEPALRLATSLSRPQFVCRSCRAQAIRQFHSSPTQPFLKQIRESLFGTAESKEAKKKRDAESQRQVAEQAKRDASKTSLEVKLDRKGRKYEVAATFDPSINPEYVMSNNWKDLKRIGGDRWIKEKQDTGENYVGFMPKRLRGLNDEQWQHLLLSIHREVVEKGTPATKHELRHKAANESDPSWMDMRLESPLVKLAIVTRIMKLTGHRISDPAMSNATTMHDLYDAVRTKPPPRKLAHSKSLKKLKKTPNVAVHGTRRTPTHKEQEIGRWKIIEEELVARDLPVTGSRWIDAKPRLGIQGPKERKKDKSPKVIPGPRKMRFRKRQLEDAEEEEVDAEDEEAAKGGRISR